MPGLGCKMPLQSGLDPVLTLAIAPTVRLLIGSLTHCTIQTPAQTDHLPQTIEIDSSEEVALDFIYVSILGVKLSQSRPLNYKKQESLFLQPICTKHPLTAGQPPDSTDSLTCVSREAGSARRQVG